MNYKNTSPLTQKEILDENFMENRNHLLEIAAFLDRLDRSQKFDAENDFRLLAFRRALQELTAADGKRIEKLQMLLSDQNLEVRLQRDTQNAYGAVQR